MQALQAASHHALKEWAVVVKALGEARQIIVLRKGGIRDVGGIFEVESQEFFFYPTFEHQQESMIKDKDRTLFQDLHAFQPDQGKLLLAYYAKVEAVLRVASAERVHRLEALHIWTPAFITQRLAYRPEESLYVLALRIHRLAHPVQLPLIPRYDGCRSWVEMEAAYPTAEALPVMGPGAFLEQVTEIQRLLA